MDDDDLPRPGSPLALILAESLDSHSIAMLEARIAALEGEIVRSRTMIARKQDSHGAADSIFRKP